MTKTITVQYGNQTMDVPDGMTLEQLKEQMCRFFPELSEPKIDTQKDGEKTTYVFSKKVGTKGADTPTLDQYGIVELMGRKVVAGKISKEEMFGAPLLRIDVPATTAQPAFTVLYGNTAIYGVTFTSEAVAKLTAERLKVDPVTVYVPELVTADEHRAAVEKLQDEILRLRNTKSLPAPTRDDQDEEPTF
jgi:PRTRC genetic system protein C